MDSVKQGLDTESPVVDLIEVVNFDDVANNIAQLPPEVKLALFMGCFGRMNRIVHAHFKHVDKKQRISKRGRAGKNKKRIK